MKCLIIVDTQYDFIPVSKEDYEKGLGGALAVPNADKIIPVINKLLPKYELVVFTKDWHAKDMEAFASSHKGKKPFDTYTLPNGETDTLWPDHCIAGTRGADLHDDIDFSKINGDFYIIKKGLEKDYHPYSGFGGTNLEQFLNDRNVDEVHICGLALDFCCIDTAIDASFKGFKPIMIMDATKPININISETKQKMIDADIQMMNSWELIFRRI